MKETSTMRSFKRTHFHLPAYTISYVVCLVMSTLDPLVNDGAPSVSLLDITMAPAMPGKMNYQSLHWPLLLNGLRHCQLYSIRVCQSSWALLPNHAYLRGMFNFMVHQELELSSNVFLLFTFIYSYVCRYELWHSLCGDYHWCMQSS